MACNSGSSRERSTTYLEMPSIVYRQGMDCTNQEGEVGNRENQATRTAEIE